MMKLTLVCLFLGMVVASPIANISPYGDTRVENSEDHSYMTPSEPMVSNEPVEPLPNGTRHPRPSHHKGKHGHGLGHHGEHRGHKEPCHHHSPPLAPPPHWPPPHSPPHGGHGAPPHEHGHSGSSSQMQSYLWADHAPEAWNHEVGYDTQDEADAWLMGWNDEAEQ